MYFLHDQGAQKAKGCIPQVKKSMPDNNFFVNLPETGV
jgi:hypothetical protein